MQHINSLRLFAKEFTFHDHDDKRRDSLPNFFSKIFWHLAQGVYNGRFLYGKLTWIRDSGKLV